MYQLRMEQTLRYQVRIYLQYTEIGQINLGVNKKQVFTNMEHFGTLN